MEGGGDTAQQQSELRQGMDGLLHDLKAKARKRKCFWKVVPCGGRRQTYEAFINELHMNPGEINILLVDSEEEIAARATDPMEDAKARVAHLKHRDKWDFSKVHPERVHLMVRCMEAWIVADAEALKSFYGKDFNPAALPARRNLEEEPKADVYKKLATATRATKKGEYGKIKHASQLLQRIDPAKVENRCPRFAILISWLEKMIDAP